MGWGTLSSRHISSEADDLHVLAASLEVPTPPEPSARLGRAALPVDSVRRRAPGRSVCLYRLPRVPVIVPVRIVSDGRSAGIAPGRGHRFRNQSTVVEAGREGSPLTRRTFLRAIYGKVLFSLLGMAILAWLAIGGLWNIATPLAMVIGVLLMTSQVGGQL